MGPGWAAPTLWFLELPPFASIEGNVSEASSRFEFLQPVGGFSRTRKGQKRGFESEVSKVVLGTRIPSPGWVQTWLGRIC